MLENQLFGVLKVKSQKDIQVASKNTGVSVEKLKYYNAHSIVPAGADLDSILKETGLSHIEFNLKLGRLDRNLVRAIQERSAEVAKLLEPSRLTEGQKNRPKRVMRTELGTLYQGDCITLMRTIKDDSIDLIFADPPFNLNKLYPSRMDDNLKESEYLDWTERWLSECVRILKPGGSLFVWNLPKWNTYISSYLNGRLRFRHWISVDIKYRLPIQGRLYPSHYALLYYCKGDKPTTFRPDRLPMEVCPECGIDLRDYGGYKDKMNPRGVNMADVWYDIPPVRHAKYKRREGSNELSLKLLDRIIEMSTEEDDLVFDPFGGSGTTYVAAEIKRRNWIGVEIGPPKDIIDRLRRITEEKIYLERWRADYNRLFTVKMEKIRKKKGLWTTDSYNKRKKDVQIALY